MSECRRVAVHVIRSPSHPFASDDVQLGGAGRLPSMVRRSTRSRRVRVSAVLEAFRAIRTADSPQPATRVCWISYYYYCYGAVVFVAPVCRLRYRRSVRPKFLQLSSFRTVTVFFIFLPAPNRASLYICSRRPLNTVRRKARPEATRVYVRRLPQSERLRAPTAAAMSDGEGSAQTAAVVLTAGSGGGGQPDNLTAVTDAQQQQQNVAITKDDGEPNPKKAKLSSTADVFGRTSTGGGDKLQTASEKLEHRLGGILCCAVCLDLPRAAIYQVRPNFRDSEQIS